VIGTSHGRSAARREQLFLAYQRTRDPRARDALVERYLPLARSLARRYRRGSEPLEDLEQVASLALVKAVDGFDPTRDTAFSSYAVPSIAGAIKRHFRDFGWSLRMPRDLQELALRVERVSEELSGPTGTAPTAAEIAQHADVGIEDVLEAREAYRSLQAISLDEPRRSEGEDREALVHTLAAKETEIRTAEDRVMLDSLLATLDPRSEQIVRLYYQHDLTQTEIGRQLGYSQMHVSRLLRQAITRLATTADDARRSARPPRDLANPALGLRRSMEALPQSIQYIARRKTAPNTQ
jgi:RNA polymerase sigma-B factor